MTTGRMKIGGILVSQDLSMICLEGAPHHPGIAGTVLEALGEKQINVDFISCCPEVGGGDTICICVEARHFDEALSAVERVQDEVEAQKVVTRSDLCSVAVFGPHFREIPNVAARIFRSFADAGINILAISTSISSVSCVFEESRLDEGLRSLRARFDVP
ncbi:MAG: ACT domain-containing protein [Candidatus Eisenbacteria bacterium]